MFPKQPSKEQCVCGNLMDAGKWTCSDCSIALNYWLGQFPTNASKGTVLTALGEIAYEEFINSIKEHGIGEVGACVICGERYVMFGNNPYPVVTDREARCCHRCNDELVIPARLEAM